MENDKAHFIHAGAGEGAYDEDKVLADYIQSALGSEYAFTYPIFSGLENWMKESIMVPEAAGVKFETRSHLSWIESRLKNTDYHLSVSRKIFREILRISLPTKLEVRNLPITVRYP